MNEELSNEQIIRQGFNKFSSHNILEILRMSAMPAFLYMMMALTSLQNDNPIGFYMKLREFIDNHLYNSYENRDVFKVSDCFENLKMIYKIYSLIFISFTMIGISKAVIIAFNMNNRIVNRFYYILSCIIQM